MKNKLRIAFIVSAFSFVLSAFTLRAQTNTPPADSGSFFTSVAGFFTSFNPDLEGSLTSHKATLWSGADFQSGAHVGSSLGLEYTVWKNFAVVSETRFADVSGTVASQSLGVGYQMTLHDVRITGYVLGAYEFEADKEKDSATAIIGIAAEKLMTTHTGLRIALNVPVEHASVPLFQAGVSIHF